MVKVDLILLVLWSSKNRTKPIDFIKMIQINLQYEKEKPTVLLVYRLFGSQYVTLFILNFNLYFYFEFVFLYIF